MRKSLAVAALLLLPSAAVAIDDPKPGDTVCYGRIYSQPHLVKNPDQLVYSLVLELQRWRDFPDELAFGLEIRLKSEPDDPWFSSGVCVEEGKGLHCAVDCDGGAFRLTEEKDAVMLRNDLHGFAGQLNCGEELEDDFVIPWIEPDKANAAYRLVRLPDDFCPDHE